MLFELNGRDAERSHLMERLRWALGRSFKALRKQGVIARMNFRCCGGCASSELGAALEKHVKKIGAAYWHQQDDARLREGHSLYIGFGAREDKGVAAEVREAATVSIGQLLVDCLKAEGLAVAWDGTAATRVQVTGMEEDKTPMHSTPAQVGRPKVELIGHDGNAFAILGRCRMAARDAGWTDERWEEVKKEMLAGDYSHLLATATKHFQVR